MDSAYQHAKFAIAITFLLLLVALGSAAYLFYRESPVALGPTRVTIGGTMVAVEIAETPLTQARGLAGYKALGDGAGMLFTFNQARLQTFWMKGMLIPIDIIWIRSGTVVGFEENVPPPEFGTEDVDLPLYHSPVPVETVLEVRAGFSSAHHVEIGDSVVIKNPNSK